MAPSRQVVLAGVLGVAVVVTAFLLWSVLWTVFFAVTVAYVRFPLRQRLVARGLSLRVASAVSAIAAFLGVVALLRPLVLALYFRRRAFFDLLAALPATVSIDLGGTTVTVDVAGVLAYLQSAPRKLALDLAAASPVIGLKATLFAFVLNALLVSPTAPVGRCSGSSPRRTTTCSRRSTTAHGARCRPSTSSRRRPPRGRSRSRSWCCSCWGTTPRSGSPSMPASSSSSPSSPASSSSSPSSGRAYW
jgi:hypothetical protein